MSDITIYQSDDGQTQREVQLDKDTVWLTQKQMADLFDRDKSVISRHLICWSTTIEQMSKVSPEYT